MYPCLKRRTEKTGRFPIANYHFPAKTVPQLSTSQSAGRSRLIELMGLRQEVTSSRDQPSTNNMAFSSQFVTAGWCARFQHIFMFILHVFLLGMKIIHRFIPTSEIHQYLCFVWRHRAASTARNRGGTSICAPDSRPSLNLKPVDHTRAAMHLHVCPELMFDPCSKVYYI